MISNSDDTYIYMMYRSILFVTVELCHIMYATSYFVTAMVCVQAYGLNCKDEATSYQYYCLHDQSQAT